ncbi:ATP-dependent helicase fft2 [Pleurostoma richardsiae]|uniref:ATP-dependent helicase fft2 n=1 Tax=Pleurostoma richardsiae TaxID=41990 RepID=A0AA38SD10_9PEZI|nr:ATP-dependent helicase fft2 [Pleurostoma richardsiae]
MAFSSSPFASPGGARTASGVPTNKRSSSQREPIYISDSDDNEELADSPYFTQPTQIVDRPTLGPAKVAAPSSPSTVVEVPASSPFQARKPPTSGRLASLMAPAGTIFRAPKPVQQKRKAIDLTSDDDEIPDPRYAGIDSSDDETPMRGDIRPVSFERRKPEPTVRASEASKRQKVSEDSGFGLSQARAQQLARKVYKLLDGQFSEQDCRKALWRHRLNIDDAVDYLLSSAPSSPDAIPAAKVSSAAPVASKGNGVISSNGDRNVSVTSRSTSASQRSSPLSPTSSQTSQSTRDTPSPEVKKPRRLMRGLKPRQSPSSSQVEATQVEKTKPPENRLVDLVSDDEEDAYSDESAHSSQADESGGSVESRALNYLQTCTVENLVAMCKVKKELAAVMIKHRPFKCLDQARKVTHKTNKAKGSKMPLGENVVDTLVEYIETLDAIDQVVSRCDAKGAVVNATLDSWKVDKAGRQKSETSNRKLIDLPCPREPTRMRGKCTLQPYQLFGINWLWELYNEDFGCILADDMGLGKTCQVIAFVCLLIDMYERGKVRSEPWPVLIVVPPSTLANWEEEIYKFAEGLNVAIYSGSQAERDEIANEILDSPGEYHIVLTTYSQLSRSEDIDAMRAIKPHISIFDEGHKMKNPKAKIYKDLARINTDWKLLLTGTPIQNNIMEMVSLLNFINPRLFANYMDVVIGLFQQRVSLQEVSQGAVLHSDRVDRARSILEPFILQRKKEHVLSTLPAKTRRVEYCDLYEKQAAIYHDYESNFRRGKEPRVRTNNGRSNDQNNVWIQLRKAAIHGQLFRRFFTDKKVKEMAKMLMDRVSQDELRQPNLHHLIDELKNCSDFELHLWCRDYPFLKEFDCPPDSWLDSGKVQKLLDLVRQFQQNGDRALVFSRFAMVITILEECLASAGIDYRVLQGDTAVSERQDLIHEFNQDASIPVFLLTTGAGGTGINLTAANKVIIFDQSDNPQDDIQAENRAHRLGQKREVEIIRLLSKGTIEELVHKACQKKLELAGKITGYAEDITAKDLESEVRNMLAEGEGAASPVAE